MHYLATNVRQNFGFHHPPGHSHCVWGGLTYTEDKELFAFLGKNNYFFHILKRNIWKVCAIPPKFSAEWRPSKWQKRVKKSSKEATKLTFHGSFGGVLVKGTWVSIFFWYYDLSEALEQLLEWKKKSFEIFVKINIFFDRFVYKTYHVL